MEDSRIAQPPPAITNGDFEEGLTGWRVVSGTAFAKQPRRASNIRSQDVEIGGRPLVPLGGNYWHTPYPIGQSGDHLIRVIGPRDGVLESNLFTIAQRFIAYRLGGSRAGVGVELRVPASVATLAQVKALDRPDPDGYVAVRIARPSGSDVLRESVWDVGPRAGTKTLVGTTAKIVLRLAARGKRRRLLFDNVRMEARRPLPFHPPLWGWADIHCHPTAQAGFGNLLAGHMHGPIEDVGSCLQLHGHHHNFPLKPVPLALEGGRRNDGSLQVSGWTAGTATGDDELGFTGWPAFNEVTHLKTHQDWIRRAYDGGQRLMVALVVHNEMLASLTFAGQSDRDTVEPQVQMMREFVAHNGAWSGLARTPAQARALIEANKLAFVLGIETDSINGWVHFSDFSSDPGAANRTAIHDRIHDYFEYLRDRLGIIQVNLIHLTDNAFGGMALYDVMFVVNSWQRTGRFPDTEDGFTGRPTGDQICTQATVGGALWDKLQGLLGNAGLTPPPPSGLPPYGQGQRNRLGLTVAGEVALLEAMRLGMVIDMDHMSEKGTQKAFEIATKDVPEIYPLISAHNGARALAPRPPNALPTAFDTPVSGQRMSPHKWPSESMKTDTQLGYIKTTRGMFGHGIAGGDSLEDPSGAVTNDCPGTSKTVAQGLIYVARKLEDIPVALGTDWNALLPGPGPRFGPQAAASLDGELFLVDATWNAAIRTERKTDADAQDRGVRYQELLRDWRPFRFPMTKLYDGTGIAQQGHFLWQGLALRKTSVDLTRQDVIDAHFDPGTGLSPAVEVALGMNGTVSAAASDFNRAGILWKDPTQLAPNEADYVKALLGELQNADRLWTAMETGIAPPLVRSTAGPVRDYDYNLDGLSHYGLLPDMFQDMKNVGLPADVIGKLFRSAEEYVRVWERSVRAAARIPH